MLKLDTVSELKLEDKDGLRYLEALQVQNKVMMDVENGRVWFV